MGRRDCPDLAGVLADWDGTFSVLVRKRVARHVDSCDICDRRKKKYAVVPMLGKVRHSTSAKARSVLGWQPRSNNEAILATAGSLIRLGLVKA